ncbi:MAG: VirB3 family type IV secretion system protein [Alphaproteobacteria bacterium]|nr:VirB3 family type IV secretion system protein [Alphaproteobacteria bacterium]
MQDAPVEIDPLFTGMTRPPMALGVPMEFFGLNFILFGIGMIFFLSLTAKALFFSCVILPLHAAGYVATEKDPHWMRIFLTKMGRCAPIRNRKFWESNSYQP